MVPTLPFPVHALLSSSLAACRNPTGVQATPTALPSAQLWSPKAARWAHSLVSSHHIVHRAVRCMRLCSGSSCCMSLLHVA